MKRVAAASIVLFVSFLAYAGLPDAAAQSGETPYGLSGEPRTSPDGVEYTYYSGEVASFDGLPLAVDVTIPRGVEGPLPLIVMVHGYGQDRTYWQSERVSNPDPIVSGWNNVAFAGRGYAVVNYTTRGFADSCGPASAADPDDPATLPAECLTREYWIHLADPKWEIRDAQFLIGRLADQGIIDPERIGVTGQSYGGGHSWLLALLNDRTVLEDGSVVPWRSPERGIPLSIAAAVPQWTWSSLTNALLVNGRATDRQRGTRRQLNDPVGIPIQSYISGLFAAGAVGGFYAPPGADPSSDLTAWFARITAGNPFDPQTDPVLRRAIRELDRRSPLYVEPSARVPVYQIQGFTDPLFPPVQAVQMRRHVQSFSPDYPIKTFFADIGHSNANNPRDVWNRAHRPGYRLFDHYLKDEGSPPAFDVVAATTRCVPGQTLRTFRASGFRGLANRTLVFESGAARTTNHLAAGPEGPATDPIANQGCLSVDTRRSAGAATWEFPVRRSFTLLGQPELTLRFVSTGRDAALNTRLWNVAPHGTRTLVSRGTYRYPGPAGRERRVTFQIMGNGWQFQRGHRLQLEVTGNDAPYYQPSNTPFALDISSVRLAVPIVERSGNRAGRSGSCETVERRGAGGNSKVTRCQNP